MKGTLGIVKEIKRNDDKKPEERKDNDYGKPNFPPPQGKREEKKEVKKNDGPH